VAPVVLVVLVVVVVGSAATPTLGEPPQPEARRDSPMTAAASAPTAPRGRIDRRPARRAPGALLDMIAISSPSQIGGSCV
jgi:hypothetical protein